MKILKLILLVLFPFILSAQAPANKPIRVGLIRCDTHGMWYGPQMQKHDPLLFSLPIPTDQPAKYSWMRGGNHYYFYTVYNQPTLMTAAFVDGFEIVKIWDEDRSVAEIAAKIFDSSPKVCDSFEEVSDDVDLVFIADCNYDGGDHLELVTPGLKKGVPTYVDKPFANSMADVEAMLKLAEENNTPIMSLSILQALPETHEFANRLKELEEVHFGTIQGAGTGRAGLIHTINLALVVFGSGIETVTALVTPNHTSIHLSWSSQPNRPQQGVMINCDTGPLWHTNLHVSAFGLGARGAIHNLGWGDWDYPRGSAEILRLVKKMVETGKAQGPVDQMIEAVAIADAADAAIKSGSAQPVYVVKPLLNH